MPRKYGVSQAVVQANIEELVKAGHPRKQAIAIALKWQREDAERKKRR